MQALPFKVRRLALSLCRQTLEGGRVPLLRHSRSSLLHISCHRARASKLPLDHTSSPSKDLVFIQEKGRKKKTESPSWILANGSSRVEGDKYRHGEKLGFIRGGGGNRSTGLYRTSGDSVPRQKQPTFPPRAFQAEEASFVANGKARVPHFYPLKEFLA
ncbi:hypothetical protein IE53DRAFT_388294 [Violaceomyces palustris]|uniref:Uncharacterized protein n=1 Tax=Violaceomyces palustris TaxID=1673888 RepID=A0ACD0NUI0_9BASI|nr:hypothetical protein IE53DRAFT_388294 [Violaceomyces palustris]